MAKYCTFNSTYSVWCSSCCNTVTTNIDDICSCNSSSSMVWIVAVPLACTFLIFVCLFIPIPINGGWNQWMKSLTERLKNCCCCCCVKKSSQDSNTSESNTARGNNGNSVHINMSSGQLYRQQQLQQEPPRYEDVARLTRNHSSEHNHDPMHSFRLFKQVSRASLDKQPSVDDCAGCGEPLPDYETVTHRNL